MITNFEHITSELTEDELAFLPGLIAGFKNRSKKNPITAPQIVKAMNKVPGKYKVKMTEPRLRKLCNHIRTNGLIPLIATSHGYYTCYETPVVQSQILSLQERAHSILKSAEGLKTFL